MRSNEIVAVAALLLGTVSLACADADAMVVGNQTIPLR